MNDGRGGRGNPGPRTRGSIGKERSWGTVAVVAAVVGVLAAFVAVVAIDMGSGGGGPPAGVREFDVASGERNHTPNAVDYEQSPPVGGAHNDVWQNQGFYEAPIRNENAVHTLEHGAVWIAYSPDLPQDQKDRIMELVKGRDCLMASPFPGLPNGERIVASAWGKQLAVESADDPKLQGFIQSFRRGPQTPEPGATCSGGTAEPA